MEPEIIKLLVAIISGLIGVFFGHYLTKDRDIRMRRVIFDREDELRRREFLRLVVRGCGRIQRPTTYNVELEDPWVTYNIAITEISAEFAMCYGYFPDAPRLLRALKTATTLEKEQVESEMRKSGESFRGVLTGILTGISEAATAEIKESEQAVTPNGP